MYINYMLKFTNMTVIKKISKFNTFVSEIYNNLY